MSDLVVAFVFIGFAVASGFLVKLCERLMGAKA